MGEPRIETTCGKGCTTCRGCCHGMSLAQVETPPCRLAVPSPLPVASLLEDPGTAAEPLPTPLPIASLLEGAQAAEELIASKDGATTGKCCSCRGQPRIKSTCGKGCTTCRGCCRGMSLAQIETLPTPFPVASLLEDEAPPNATFPSHDDFLSASL